MRALILAFSALWLSACMVELEGAPCEQDSNCPRAQWCQVDGTCTARTPTVAEACEVVVEMATRKTVSCYGGSLEAWRKELPRPAICDSIATAVTAQTLTFTPTSEAIRQCNASLLERPCERLELPTALHQCDLFAPAAGLGSPCHTPYDCTEGWCQVTSTCPGTCAAYIEDDQACVDGDRCRPGSVCASDGFCRKYRLPSEACSSELPCDPYLANCNGNPGVCEPKKLSGACGFSDCAATYRCSPPLFGGTCNPARAVGEPCTPGQYQCELLSRCSDVTRLCEPISDVGGACGLNFEGEIVLTCLASRCDGNSCANYLATGQSCSSDGECGPLAHCDGVCVPDFCR